MSVHPTFPFLLAIDLGPPAPDPAGHRDPGSDRLRLVPSASQDGRAADADAARTSPVGRVRRLLASASHGEAATVRLLHGARRESLRMLATVEAPARSRRFVEEVLVAWGCAQDVRYDLVLVVSELVSEATRYPLAADVEVRLVRRHGRIELSVIDQCPQPPSCADGRSGTSLLVRGLLESCTEHWDWSVEAPAGRTVRASVVG